jgi:hypothetical protein
VFGSGATIKLLIVNELRRHSGFGHRSKVWRVVSCALALVIGSVAIAVSNDVVKIGSVPNIEHCGRSKSDRRKNQLDRAIALVAESAATAMAIANVFVPSL